MKKYLGILYWFIPAFIVLGWTYYEDLNAGSSVQSLTTDSNGKLQAHLRDGTQATIVTDTVVAGVFAPVSSGPSNIQSGPTFSADWHYIRVGDVVTLGGAVTVDVGSGQGNFEIDLPVARIDGNFDTLGQGSCSGGTIDLASTFDRHFIGNSFAGDQKLTFIFDNNGDQGNANYFIQCSYKLINE